jgi:hypothetical protein
MLNSIAFILQFKLEDTSQSSSSATGNSTQQPQPTSANGVAIQESPKASVSLSAAARRQQHSSENSVPNDANSAAATKETPVTPNRSDDDKGGEIFKRLLILKINCLLSSVCLLLENDKENDSRSGLAIHRRRRPKRRSTGVVHVDMEVRIALSHCD